MKFSDKLSAIQAILNLEIADGQEISVELNTVTATPVEPSVSASEEMPEPVRENVSGSVMLGSVMVEAEITEEGENVLFVEDFSAVPNSCGTGRVKFNGSELTLNMCQMEESTTIYLPTVVDGVRKFDTPFKLAIGSTLKAIINHEKQS